jgi:hypothetical protein
MLNLLDKVPQGMYCIVRTIELLISGHNEDKNIVASSSDILGILKDW